MFKKAVMAVALVGAAASAQAATVNVGGVDVGAVDTFIAEIGDLPASCGPGGSPTTELCWINSVLDPDTIYGEKREEVDVLSSDTTGVVAFELWAPSEYFMIKNATNWALFRNNGDLNWAVIDLADLKLKKWNIKGGGSISHAAPIGGDVPQVPLPGTLGLLGLGLAGLGAMRRKKQEA